MGKRIDPKKRVAGGSPSGSKVSKRKKVTLKVENESESEESNDAMDESNHALDLALQKRAVYSESVSKLHIPFTPIGIKRALEQQQKKLFDVAAPYLKSIRLAISQLPPNLFPQTRNSVAAWERLMLEGISANAIQTEISGMEEGTLLPIYLMEQNVAVVLRRTDSNVTLSFFPPKPEKTLILQHQKVKRKFPQHSFSITFSKLLRSEEFARIIYECVRVKINRKTISVVEFLALSLTSENDFAETEDFSRIVKTVRDESGDKETLRSGYWIVLKTSLHLSLVEELGNVEGTFLYKILILRIHLDILETLEETACIHQNIEKTASETRYEEKDPIDEIRKKVYSKVTKINNSFFDLPENLKKLKTDYLREAKRKLLEISIILDKPITWQTGILIDEDFEDRAMKGLQIYLDKRRTWTEDKSLRRSLRSEKVDSDLQQKQIEKKLLQQSKMMAFDILVREGVSLQDNSLEILTSLLTYTVEMMEILKSRSDPVQSSRMILTFFKCVQLLDKIAMAANPVVLGDYDCLEFEISPIFANLVVTHKEESDFANNLEEYFNKRKREARNRSTLISDEFPSQDSVHIKLAEKVDSGVSEFIKEENRKLVEKDIEKKAKIQQKIKEYNTLSLNETDAICNLTNHRKSQCQKCKYQKAMNKIGVKQYVRMPMDNLINQTAFAYEQVMPKSIFCLRDALFLTHVIFCPREKRKPHLGRKVAETTNVKWKPVKKSSQYKYVLEERHVSVKTILIKDYLRDQRNCSLFAKSEQVKYSFKWNFHESEDNFAVWKTDFDLPVNSPYGSLSQLLTTWTHDPNQVHEVAIQETGTLSKLEMTEFGLLRSGASLQLTNLFRALSSKALSLNQETCTLILQSLWQLGPLKSTGGRAAQSNLMDDAFATRFLMLLDEIVKEVEDSWTESYTLMTAILISKQFVEFNSNAISDGISLLQKCKRITLKWIKELMNVVEGSPIEQEKARRHLLTVGICGALILLNISKSPLGKLLVEEDFEEEENRKKTRENVLLWLTCREIIVNEKSTDDADKSTFVSVICHLIDYQSNEFLANKVQEIIDEDNSILDTYAIEHPGVNSVWGSWEKDASTYKCTVENNENDFTLQLELDIATGQFLINGDPCTRLPDRIMTDPTFIRLFGQTNFRVSCETSENGSKTYTTKRSTERGPTFEFTLIPNIPEPTNKQKQNLIIKQHTKDGENSELVPVSKIETELPHVLSENYSHWWILNSNREKEDEIIFKSVNYTTKDGFGKRKYHLNVDSNILTNSLTNTTQENHDKKAKNMMKVLGFFESPKHILIMRSQQGFIAELPRHNLSFHCRHDKIISTEHNMIVVAEEDESFVRSFQGISRYLVLEEMGNSKSRKRSILIPHGTLEMKKPWVSFDDENEATTYNAVINIDKLRKPSNFIFEINSVLRIFSAGPFTCAWLYMAALHAVTASVTVDDFTRLTGLERAVQILQSGKCRSFSPYDTESLTTIKFICKLFPKRKRATVTKVEEECPFQEHLPNYAIYDGYFFIIKKIVEESKAMDFLHSTEQVIDGYNEIKKILDDVDENLMARGYWSTIKYYNEAARVSKDLMPEKFRQPESTEMLEEVDYFPLGKTVCALRTFSSSSWTPPNSQENQDFDFLFKSNTLQGLTPLDDISWLEKIRKFQTFNDKDFIANWMNLYRLALTNTKEDWTLLLNCLVYSSFSQKNRGFLECLQTIFNNKDKFPKPPTIRSYYGLKQTNDEHDEILMDVDVDHEFLLRNFGFTTKNTIVQKFLSRWNHHTRAILEDYGVRKWDEMLEEFFASALKASLVDEANLNEVKRGLQAWKHKYVLRSFVKQVQRALKTCSNSTQDYIQAIPKLTKLHEHHPAINFDIHPKPIIEISPAQESKAFISENDIEKLWNDLDLAVKAADEFSYATSLSLRKAPSIVFPILLLPVPPPFISPETLKFIRHLLIQTTKYQRTRDKSEQETPTFKIDAEKYPEWLILELEMNISIREVQVDIAKHMINNNPEEGSKVTQLNMGEGKTTIILPMIMSTLAKRKNELIRVIVLKSQYPTNFSHLKNAMGGLLNLQVFSLPCDRHLKLTDKQVNKVLSFCKNMMEKGGILLTVPECRLSWDLRFYESFLKEPSLCNSLQLLFSWNVDNCRDILDESDEILNPRYQKVYAMGASQTINELKWTTAQKILQKIPAILLSLSASYKCVQISKVTSQDEFPRHCLLLNYTQESDICYEKFVKKLAGEFIEKELANENDETKQNILEYLTNSKFTQSEYDSMQAGMSASVQKLPMINIIAEYLSHPGILKSALSKRWRVNYGVDLQISSLAVPYKAKDVAYEKTEFGHPGMSIVLTQFSYYYSGLTREQFEQCLDILSTLENADVEFNGWMQNQTLKINYNKGLSRENIRVKELFAILKCSMPVINFYLSHYVFPSKLKFFPEKITTTAWDIGFSKKGNLAGFSGTDDFQTLLPRSIKQKNLPKLSKAKMEMEQAVKAQNKPCIFLSDIEGKKILETLKNKNIKVLIDAGALMTDMRNSEVADCWLNLDETLKGVAFFDDDNKIIIRNRNEVDYGGQYYDTDFDSSPYHESLKTKCAVYMDDEHTRGSDFKFPPTTAGCVTLGDRLPRDKLMQACMRMRNLIDRKHSILFIASQAAENHIKSISPNAKNITGEHIIAWAIKNTQELEEEALPFHAKNALNFVKKRASILNFADSKDPQRAIMEIVEKEHINNSSEVALRSPEKFSSVLENSFNTCLLSQVENINPVVANEITKLFNDVKDYTVNLIQNKISGTCSSSLEEQQEREVELDKEQQVQLSQDLQIDRCIHYLYPSVVQFVKGEPIADREGIQELAIPGLYASLDFLNVETSGKIRRPVNWLITNQHETLFISPFEANKIIPLYWEVEAKPTTLHCFSPRTRRNQTELINEEALQCGEKKQVSPELLAKIQIYGGTLYFEENEEEAYKTLKEQIEDSFDITKNIMELFSRFPETSDVWKLLNW